MSIDLIAIVLSIISLGVSSWLAARQILMSERANHLPAYLSLLSAFRSREFNDHYLYVCEERQKSMIQTRAFQGFPTRLEKQSMMWPIIIRI